MLRFHSEAGTAIGAMAEVMASASAARLKRGDRCGWRETGDLAPVMRDFIHLPPVKNLLIPQGISCHVSPLVLQIPQLRYFIGFNTTIRSSGQGVGGLSPGSAANLRCGI